MTGRRGPDPEQPPFIIRKLRSRRTPHPHGAWKVAYADFVTSMMALFIVLWAAEQSPVIRSSIATYFRNPSALPAGREQSGILPAGAGVVALPAAGAVGDRDEEALTEAAVRLHAALVELAPTDGCVTVDGSRLHGYDVTLLQLLLAFARARGVAGRAVGVVPGPAAARLRALGLGAEIA
ncbi:MAG: hypothetical protein AUH30_18585 [Candidatus Rokubacteria bacterium 13_1_40CM_68_15]|nr:MAG: hypothetical protein AUH30_18585 [Candidatus Rokubacteria bacterium 13_1_40CM_68_15]